MRRWQYMSSTEFLAGQMTPGSSEDPTASNPERLRSRGLGIGIDCPPELLQGVRSGGLWRLHDSLLFQAVDRRAWGQLMDVQNPSGTRPQNEAANPVASARM